MSTDTDQELTTPQVRMKKSGDLIQRIDGAEVIVANYNQATGYLEFTNKEYSEKLYNQVIAKIGTVNKGTTVSGNVVKAIGIKGVSKPDLKNIPKRPKMDPKLGDTTPDVVEWFFEHNPTEAIIRYGVYTDAKGNPRRANCIRKFDELRDNRGMDDTDIEKVNDGPKTFTKSPVAIVKEMDRFKNQIIARRATCMTFTPEEVEGDFEDEDGMASTDEGGDE